MKRTFSTLVYPKRNKANKQGLVPLYFRITLCGEKAELSLQSFIPERDWDPRRKLVKGASENASELNDQIQQLRFRAQRSYRDFQESGKRFSAKDIKESLLPKEERSKTLIELFEIHNSEMKELVGKGRSKATYGKFLTSLKHLKAFLSSNGKSDITLERVDYNFICDFEHYLKTEAQCIHNSAMKHIKALKKIMILAKRKDLIDFDPFDTYKITQEKVERDWLTREEIKRIQALTIDIPRIQVTKDLFLFQCYTGLSFSDMANLSKRNVECDSDGVQWLVVHRTKTGIRCDIPLSEQAKELITKYQKDPWCQKKERLLPVPSNQKTNAYLKEVADLCRIPKTLTTHIARHTFATNALDSGVPVETVSKILGHRKLSTTMIYGKVLRTKIVRDIASLEY